MDDPPFPDHSGAWPDDGEAPRSASAPRYTRERKLGAGGMGEVWEARDPVLRRAVALKVVRPDLPEASRIRLVREARITASLDHPGIVPVFDAGEDADRQPWFAMRVVRGRSLSDAIRDAETGDARLDLLPAVLAACDAVAYAHAAGVVHRDLKPDNIHVGPHGEVQVMDWGLARAPDEDPAWSDVLSRLGTKTRAGIVLGTPAWMSPEQARGGEVTPASDVWSLGLILYEVVSGRRAYAAPSAEQVISQVLAGPPPPIAGIAPELAALLDKALQHDAAARYPDAGALASDLRAWVLGKRVGAHRYSVGDELRRQLQRYRWPVLAGFALLVGQGIAGTVGFVRAETERARLAAAEKRLEAALTQADDNLGAALVAQADAAVEAGNWGRAEVLAAKALTLAESPSARGVLAGARSAERPRLSGRVEIGACDDAVLTSSAVLCLTDGVLTAHDLEGEKRWSTLVDGRELVVDGAETVVYVALPTQMLPLSLASGAAVAPPIAGDVMPRQAPSQVPQVVLSLQNTAHPVVALLSPEGRDRVVDLCPASVLLAAQRADGAFVRMCERGLLEAPGRARVDVGDWVANPWRLALSASGERAAIGGMFGEVQVVDLTTGEVRMEARFGQAIVGGMRFGPRERWLAVDIPGEGTLLIDTRSGVRHQLPRASRTFSFSGPDTLELLVGETLERWRLPPDGPTPSVSTRGGVVGFDWREGGFAYATGNAVGLVAVEQGRVKEQPIGHVGNKSAALRADGMVEVAGCSVATGGTRTAASRPSPGCTTGRGACCLSPTATCCSRPSGAS